ncbi:MAG: dihydroneopterin aldolase [Bacteroidales bacterium]|nr:dihydroneopterin aldolase [Bacteroidales bacterium]
MGKIILEGMEFFAYHGCFHEEQIIGTRFVVEVELEVDTTKAEASDHLEDTVNYQSVYGLVRHEMEQKSQLIEHVGRRILDAISHTFPQINSLQVTISKVNPPIGGKVKQVTCVLTR